jgi:hypothetical protein
MCCIVAMILTRKDLFRCLVDKAKWYSDRATGLFYRYLFSCPSVSSVIYDCFSATALPGPMSSDLGWSSADFFSLLRFMVMEGIFNYSGD